MIPPPCPPPQGGGGEGEGRRDVILLNTFALFATHYSNTPLLHPPILYRM